jgi:hypothetical protein
MTAARVATYRQAVRFYDQPSRRVVRVAALANGDQGLQQLTDAAQAAIEAGIKKPEAWEWAREIVAHIKPGDRHAEVRAVYDYLAGDEIPYRLDAIGSQIVPSFEAAAASRGVDCKGKTVLMAVLVGSLGNDVRAVTVDQHVGKPGRANRHHIYAEWRTPEGPWQAIDPVLALQLSRPRPGQELPYKIKMVHRSPE